jgi:hypothetical protein
MSETQFVSSVVAADRVTKMVTGLSIAELATASPAEAQRASEIFAKCIDAFGPGEVVWVNRHNQFSKLVLRTLDAVTASSKE